MTESLKPRFSRLGLMSDRSEIEQQIDIIIDIASSEGFEDGMEGRLSQSLKSFILEYSVASMQQLAARLNSSHMNQAVAADIVRVLGRIVHAPSHDDRVHMAERLLFSDLPLARDAGAVALSDLVDKRCIPALRTAIEAEPIPRLKADLQASLEELIKGTGSVHSQDGRL